MRLRATTALLTALALAAAACGGERTFEPEEFVEEANSKGAGLELGEPLISTREGLEVYELRLIAAVQATRKEHASGSLIVAEDPEKALAEYHRCEAAATLICYRAANVVLALEGGESAPGLASVDRAIRALGKG